MEYVKPEMEIVKFECRDVVRTSMPVDEGGIPEVEGGIF
jgi:hypothetical protein